MSFTHWLPSLETIYHALMQLFDYCNLSHIHRERNAVADILAKDSIGISRGTVFFNSPPAHLAHVVFEDIAGNGCTRLKGLRKLGS